MSNVWYLALGFGAVWLLVAAYLVYLGRRQALLAKRLDEADGRGGQVPGLVQGPPRDERQREEVVEKQPRKDQEHEQTHD